jgi:hypothetical protein
MGGQPPRVQHHHELANNLSTSRRAKSRKKRVNRFFFQRIFLFRALGLNDRSRSQLELLQIYCHMFHSD